MKPIILLSNDYSDYDWININGMTSQILKKDNSQINLRRLLNMDANKRIGIVFSNSECACWATFRQIRRCLINLEIPIRLRMRLFDASLYPFKLI